MPDEAPPSELSADALLELHCACAAFLRRRAVKEAPDRERLRRALIAILIERGANVMPELIASHGGALAALRGAVARCRELNVNWQEVAAIVNRETRPNAEPAQEREQWWQR